ncbi:MAG: bifunctional phosphoribosylaminoimidazolecarboxamide formyltransferase/IMP cyclohydrolase [Candidatus Altiarchaeales archaeon]|nr:bifunctional phosphoribosylaminoimidazolecarboxamide formyltransferase/IMP cyclohydrolase [Candidatus Altiarchaeales archaeon]
MRIKRALLSVSDKEGIVEFAKSLAELGIELVATDKTGKLLRENKIPVRSVEEVTGFPEILDGRVKTLHPKIHAALLSIHDKEGHRKQLAEHEIVPIDMLVVNLYPFKETISKSSSMEEAIENIDVGGPAMIRAASKNFQDVVVVISPAQYPEILEELKEGDVGFEKRKALAFEAFKVTSNYDALIYDYLMGEAERFPQLLSLRYENPERLRYGENPHQSAALYRELLQKGSCITKANQIHGEKDLSFNNILDMDAALSLIREFERPTVAIIKHSNPSGVASSDDLSEAYRKAYACDEYSAFGSVVAVNRPVDKETAEEISKLFIEVVIAPSFGKEAMDILGKKKNLRVLELNMDEAPDEKFDFRKVSGGLLVQTPDVEPVGKDDLKVVTKKKPTEEDMKSLLFAWKVVKHVKSNAIVLARDGYTVGIGAGQMSRIDSVDVAVRKAGENAAGSVMASDAFFPFRDSIDAAAKAGIKAIIQPGGSIKDEECIRAADEHGIAMVFTEVRCFKH